MNARSDGDAFAGIAGLDRIVAESLEALGDADMAPRLLAHIARALGSRKAVLFCPLPGIAPEAGAALQAHQWGMPQDFLARYAQLIQVRDAWSDALAGQQAHASQRGGSLSQQLIATRELRRSAFYADYLRPLSIDAMVNSIVEASPGGGMHVLALYNEQGRGEFTPAQFAQLRAATPWVRSLMRAQRRLQHARQQAGALERGLDQLPMGVLQVSAHGELRFANQHARAWLALADDCRILLHHAGAWRARRAHTLAQLHPALAPLACACRDARTPLSARVQSAQGQPLVALAAALRAGPGDEPLVQLVLVPERAPPGGPATAAVCSALYGLTPAEAALLPLLLQGMTPRDMAQAQQVKLPTVRTQLASLFAKTGTRGQAALAQRVLRVAALVP